MTEQNRDLVCRIQKLEEESNESQANIKAQLQEYKSKMDSLNSENQTLQERNTVLTEQNRRHSTFRGQVAYFLAHPACIVCIISIIISCTCLHFNKIAALTELNDRQASQIDGHKIELDEKNSENHILWERNAVLIEQNNHQASQIGGCEIKLDAKDSENRLLREQIAFANKQNGFLQTEMKKMGVEFKEKHEQALTVHLQESQWNMQGGNYLVQCLKDNGGTSGSFTGLSLFWGAVQLGYTTQSGLENCLKMYEAHFHQRISYQEDI